MKKKLEAELMSLAHSVLQLRGRENIEDLRDHARMLYEKLSMLSFVEEHFSTPHPTIGKEEVITALESGFVEPQDEGAGEDHKIGVEPEPLEAENDTDPIVQEEPGAVAEREEGNEPEEELLVSNRMEKDQNWDEGWTPSMEDPPVEEPEIRVEDRVGKDIVEVSEGGKTEESKPEEEPEIIEEDNLENISVHLDDLPEFEPVFTTPNRDPESSLEEVKDAPRNPSRASETWGQQQGADTDFSSSAEKPRTRNEATGHHRNLNEKLQFGLKFGLNDRLAFTQHLFEGSAADFNRIVSQLNTLRNYEEARRFIENQVKPDYDWADQEVYEKRFLAALEHKME